MSFSCTVFVPTLNNSCLCRQSIDGSLLRSNLFKKEKKSAAFSLGSTPVFKYMLYKHRVICCSAFVPRQGNISALRMKVEGTATCCWTLQGFSK